MDTSSPRFTWEYSGNEEGFKASRYEVRIGTSPNDLRPYAEGMALKPHTRYYWNVTVWDGEGRPCATSETASFETAKFDPSDWSASWITDHKDKEFEQSKDMDAACAHIDERLTPYYPTFIREVTKEDILKLMEIKMGRILKFNSDKADELIAKMKEEIAEIDNHLAHIVDYTVNWYQMLKNKYGIAPERLIKKAEGDTNNRFAEPELNRAVIVE